jgi:hypothetical protein
MTYETQQTNDKLVKLRRVFWAILVIGLIVAVDLALANYSPTPTSQAISNVENSPAFKYIVGNGTYNYGSYYDNPSLHQYCGPKSPLPSGLITRIDPFHEYTTVTLTFALMPNDSHPSPGSSGEPLIILVQANPSSGSISSIKTLSLVACF